VRVFGDGLEFNCPMVVHTFQRNVTIPKVCDLRESVELFLWSGAWPDEVLEEHVEVVAQIQETSQAQRYKSVLRVNCSEVLLQNTKESADN
jgi:hypothetical protein